MCADVSWQDACYCCLCWWFCGWCSTAKMLAWQNDQVGIIYLCVWYLYICQFADFQYRTASSSTTVRACIWHISSLASSQFPASISPRYGYYALVSASLQLSTPLTTFPALRHNARVKADVGRKTDYAFDCMTANCWPAQAFGFCQQLRAQPKEVRSCCSEHIMFPS